MRSTTGSWRYRTLLEEADSQGIDTRKATDLLLRTKRMFESGRYADARATSAAAYAETEVIVAPFMAQRKVQEAKELVLAMDNARPGHGDGTGIDQGGIGAGREGAST